MTTERSSGRREIHLLTRVLGARRAHLVTDLGQTAIVAVLAITLIIGIIGGALVASVVQSAPLQAQTQVTILARRALEAGENAYVTAINTNPSLAQCNTGTNDSATCSGIDYGEWNPVPESNTLNLNGDAEYYAFGNPQPTFDPTTHALTNMSVQVVGAARSTSTTNNYLFDTETINLASTNGFLTHVWWSNYESYNQTGDYSGCSYNWASDNYDANSDPGGCEPVTFASSDYLFGPTYTNDSVFVSSDGGGPTFGNASSSPKVPSVVETADPRCLFVDSSHGMNGNGGAAQNDDGNCASANSDVGLYDSTNSSYGHTVEQPPQSDGQLATIASEFGCLYSGPTSITLTGSTMTVTSPDTVVSTVSDNGTPVPWDNNNVPNNYTDCPTNGSGPLPADGVIYVETASGSAGTSTQPPQPIIKGANPFDDYLANSVTNVTASPTPTPVTAGKQVTLTATVTSSVPQIGAGATVAFSQTENSGGTSSHAITSCASQANWSAPVAVGSNWQSTVTCPNFPEISTDTGVFSAVYSGGTYTNTSQGTLGATNTLTPGVSWGADSQTTAGGCASCYYGESSSPDAEGDAFVSGALSGQLTIGTSNNVVVTGNVTYQDCGHHWTFGQSGLVDFCPYFDAGTNDSLGLIANNYVEVNHPVTNPDPGTGAVLASCSTPGALCDASTSQGATINGNTQNGLTIDAAILALTQSFVVNNYKVGGPEGQLAIYGSVQQYARGPVGQFNTQGIVSGYVKNYTWDPLLDYVSPPDYLVPSTAPWDLTSITANAGEHPSNVCPPLAGPYPNGAATPITTYCSQAVGGLPGYPASTAPSPPTGVTAVASVGGVATVSWSAPDNTGSSAIIRYNVTPNPPCPTCSGLTTTGALSTSVAGLTPGTNYTFTVTATNSNGTSSPSAPSPLVSAPLVPYPPTSVSALGNANESVSVSWTDPPSANISRYNITPSPACGSCTGLQVNSATATTTTITGLTVGATYTFTVTATNNIGTSVASNPSNAIEVPTKPGAPTGVAGTSFANTQSVVSWSAPASNGGLAISTYTVTSSPGNKTCSTPTTSCTVTGLTNGTPYTFTVTATNTIGTGAASAPSAPATPAAAPGTPTMGTATAGNGQASVTFSTPATNGAPITGYTLTSSPGGITATCSSSPCVITGLTNGTPYTFKVVANSAAGSSGSSGSSNSVTPIGPPSAPLSVSATSNANTQSVVTWSAPATNGGSAITKYTVTSSGGQTCTTTGATSCTVTGLTNGTPYTFTVTATNSLGTGVASAPSAAATPATVPGAPTGVTAVAGYTQATVSWSAPVSNGGATITGYTVTSGTHTCSSAGTSCVVTGLTDGTAYTFTVVAINAAGSGPASAASNSVTPTTTAPGAPTGVSASSYANAQSAVTWTAPTYTGGSAITHYTVTSSPGGKTCTTPNGTTTTCTVTGLTNGTPYTFTVTATNGVGTGLASTPSASATPSTVPGSPTGVTATTHQNASSVVSWSAPASNGGNPITSYTVTSSSGSHTCTTTGATTCTVSGLTNGTSYTFTVTATNGSGTSAPSSASGAIVPATAPGAPTGVTATSNASTQSVVSWTAPSSNGGLAITGYTVTSNALQTCTTTGATSCVVTGLSNGVAYTFTVTATNAVGTGPASAASAPAIPAGPPTAPTAVRATSGQNTSSAVSWAAPSDDGGSPVTTYTVTSSPGGLTCTTTGAMTCTVNGLTNGTTYTFTVTATNSAGTSVASSPSNAIVPASTPGAPTGVTASNVPGIAYGASPKAIVSWTAPTSTGGSPITGYTVTSGTHTCSTGTGTSTTCIFEGLTAGTTYSFTVVAINAIGIGPASSPASCTLSTEPDAPSSVTGTPVPNVPYTSTPQMTVSWTAPNTGGSPITGYTATASNGSTCSSATTSCTIPTGFTVGTAYTFTVTAMNVSGTGLASPASPAVVAATVPQAPTIGAASYTTGIAYGQPPQVKVTWTDPANNGGNAITGYQVTSSPTGGTCSVTGVTATTCTVSSGLTAGIPYTFSVQALNAVGLSASSGSTASVTPATVPAAPTGVSAANVSGTPYNSAPQVTVSWTASANGGAAVTGYTVTASGGGGTCSTAGTSCIVSGALTAGTSYTFTVTAANAAGASQPSGSVALVAATVPQAPTIGTATYVTGIAYGQAPQVVVNWTDPANNGGAAITGYTVTASSGSGTCSATGPTATTCTVSSGLTAGTAYTFSVKATNSVGASGSSGASASVTPATAPQAPTIGSVSNQTGIGYGLAPHVTVNWTDPANNGGAPVTGYTVTSLPSGGTCAGPTGTSTSCTITTGLTAGVAYTFSVTATNAAATSSASSPSASLTPATVPQAPTVGTATNVAGIAYNGSPEVTVSWTAGNNGGSAVTGFTVTASSGTGTCSSAGTSCTITTGLTAGTAYTFTVSATNGAGTSTSSGNSNSVTPATVPQAPTIGSAAYALGIAYGANPQVTVTWTDPSNNGGAAVSSYAVTSTPAGGTCAGTTGTSTSCTISSGLTAGTAYTFTVTATNSAGTSALSSPTSSITPATLPSVPTGVTATNVAGVNYGGTPQANVTWTASANGGSAITGYTVTASSGGGTCTTSGTTCSISGSLTAGTSYTYTVTATNGAGTTAASSPSPGVTAATVAQAPTIGTATNVNGILYNNSPQVVVTWTDPAANGGSAITGYTVTANTGGGTCTVLGATATTCTVSSNLTAGSSYQFSVKANNAAGSSAASALVGQRHAGDGAQRPHHRHGDRRDRAPQRLQPRGDGHLDRPGRQRRFGHHRLHRDRQPGWRHLSRLGGDGDHLHLHLGADRRHLVHLHRDGHQLRRYQRILRRHLQRDPGDGPGRSHRGDRRRRVRHRVPRQPPDHRVVDPGIERRLGRLVLPGHGQPRWGHVLRHDRLELHHLHRPDGGYELHVHGHVHQRRRHQPRLHRLVGRDRGHRGPGADHRHRHQRQRDPLQQQPPGGGHLDRSGQQRWLRHHRLHRDGQHRRRHLHRPRGDGDHLHRLVEPDRRLLLPVLGQGQQRRRVQCGLRAVGQRHAGDGAQRPHHRHHHGGDRHRLSGRPPGRHPLDRPGRQRRFGHHRLHRDGQHRWRLLHGHRGDGDHLHRLVEPDRRFVLQLLGRRHQRRGQQRVLGAVQHRGAGHRVGPADRGGGDLQCQRQLGGVLDRSGVQWRIDDHRLHGHLDARQLHLHHHRRHQLHGVRTDQRHVVHLRGHRHQR